MRIAQLIFTKVEVPVLEETTELSDTRRGIGGFGSTGLLGIGIGTYEHDEKIREKDRYYMGIAIAASERSTCIRGVKKNDGQYERDSQGNLVGRSRKFGCVIVKNDNIIAHGFNDQYPGSLKCTEVGCLREQLKIPSGEQVEKCRAVHAEWWAIANMCRSGASTGTEGSSIYMNTEPCEICAKIIAYLGVDEVIMLENVYPTNGTQILRDASINIRYVKMD